MNRYLLALPSQLWALATAVALAIVGAFILTPDRPSPAPSLLLPVAVVGIVGITGFGLSLKSRSRIVFVLLIAALFGAAYAGTAFAQAASVTGAGAVDLGAVITIDALTLSFLAGSVMPLLTALATKLDASSTVKGVVNLVLSIFGGVLVAFKTGAGTLTYQEIAASAIATYLSAQALYSGVLRKPALAIAQASPEGGIG